MPAANKRLHHLSINAFT